MNILVLNGSPRKHGNTAFMIDAFLDGAKQQGHHVDVISVCEKNINGNDCIGVAGVLSWI